MRGTRAGDGVADEPRARDAHDGRVERVQVRREGEPEPDVRVPVDGLEDVQVRVQPARGVERLARDLDVPVVHAVLDGLGDDAAVPRLVAALAEREELRAEPRERPLGGEYLLARRACISAVIAPAAAGPGTGGLPPWGERGAEDKVTLPRADGDDAPNAPDAPDAPEGSTRRAFFFPPSPPSSRLAGSAPLLSSPARSAALARSASTRSASRSWHLRLLTYRRVS